MQAKETVRALIAASAEPPLDVAALKGETALLDIGIDSLKFMLLVIDVEQQLGRPIFDVESVPTINTVQDLVNLVH